MSRVSRQSHHPQTILGAICQRWSLFKNLRRILSQTKRFCHLLFQISEHNRLSVFLSRPCLGNMWTSSRAVLENTSLILFYFIPQFLIAPCLKRNIYRPVFGQGQYFISLLHCQFLFLCSGQFRAYCSFNGGKRRDHSLQTNEIRFVPLYLILNHFLNKKKECQTHLNPVVTFWIISSLACLAWFASVRLLLITFC